MSFTSYFPWTLTVNRYEREGIAPELREGLRKVPDYLGDQVYFQNAWSKGVLDYERALGFDPVRRNAGMQISSGESPRTAGRSTQVRGWRRTGSYRTLNR